VDHAQDLDVILVDGVDDDVFGYGEAAKAGAKVLRAATANEGMLGEQEEAAGEGVDEAVGDFYARAFGGDVIPDGVEVVFGLRGYAKAHQADRASSVARRARPRSFTDFASSCRESSVSSRPSPRAREARASVRVARKAMRLRSRSSQRARASATASSSLRRRPSATASWMKACWSGVRVTSIGIGYEFGGGGAM